MSSGPTKPRQRIVVIDDDPTQLRLLEKVLGAQGFEVVVVDSPIGATNVVARSEPVMVLIDLNMPAIDGRQLCKLLRKHPRTQDLPILFLSAQPATELAQAVAETGADGFLEKGSDLDLIRSEVQRLAGPARDRATPVAATRRPPADPRPSTPTPVPRPHAEKRRQPRHALISDVRVEVVGSSTPLTGYVGNVSRGGMALYVDVRIAEGAAVRLHVPVEAGVSSADVSGSVRWSRPLEGMWVVGLAFDGASDEELAAVDKLVDAIEQQER